MTDDIPTFLLREAPPTPKRRRRIASKRRWIMPSLPYEKLPPNSAEFKNATRVDVMLGDECPRVGSGYRRVWAKRARVWAYLCDASGNRATLPVEVFDKVVRP